MSDFKTFEGKIPFYIHFRDASKDAYTVPEIVTVIRDNFGYIDINDNALGQAIRRYARNSNITSIEGTSERKTMYSKDTVENMLMGYMYGYLLKLNGKYQERQSQVYELNERMKNVPEPYELIDEPITEEEEFNLNWNKVYDDLVNKIVIDYICNNMIELNKQLLIHDAKLSVQCDESEEKDLELYDRMNNVGIYYCKK